MLSKGDMKRQNMMLQAQLSRSGSFGPEYDYYGNRIKSPRSQAITPPNELSTPVNTITEVNNAQQLQSESQGQALVPSFGLSDVSLLNDEGGLASFAGSPLDSGPGSPLMGGSDSENSRDNTHNNKSGSVNYYSNSSESSDSDSDSNSSDSSESDSHSASLRSSGDSRKGYGNTNGSGSGSDSGSSGRKGSQ